MIDMGEDTKDFYTNWSEMIKNIKLTEREPMWQKAIVIMIKEGDLEPTIQLSLSQEHLQDMIFAKGVKGEEASIYSILIDIAEWVKLNTFDYLARNFYNGADVTLAYIMATQYDLYWDGDSNVIDWIPEKADKEAP